MEDRSVIHSTFVIESRLSQAAGARVFGFRRRCQEAAVICRR